MNKLLVVLTIGCLGLSGCKQKSAWLTDWPMAQAQARAEGKLVLLDYTGSDWCPGCILFHDEVAMSPEFVAYAKTNLVLMEVDFPRKHPQPEALVKANAELVGKFKIADATGDFPLPTLLLVDSNGVELARWQGYEPGSGAKPFIASLEKIKKP